MCGSGFTCYKAGLIIHIQSSPLILENRRQEAIYQLFRSFQSRHAVFLGKFNQPSFRVYIYICQFVQFIYIFQPYAFRRRRASVEPKATEKLLNRLWDEIIVSNATFLPHGTGLNPFQLSTHFCDQVFRFPL